MGWQVYSRRKLYKLLSKSELQESRALLAGNFFSDVSITVKRGQQQNETPLLHYCAIIAVVEEEAARPSKCQSFLLP